MKKIYKYYFLFFILIIASMIVCGCEKQEQKRSTEEREAQSGVEEIYRTGLSQYLLEVLDLEKYDKELVESDMNYIPYYGEGERGANCQTEEQKRDRLGLTYIYLRNELHLDRLSEEETKILEKEAENTGTDTISDEAMEMIINTFPDVISSMEIKTPEDKEVMTFYDNNTDFVEVNALVLKIGTNDEFDENGEWVNKEHEVEKQRALKAFSDRMESELNGKLGDIPIRVRRDFSLFSEDGNGFMN